jgi:acid phosphatase family membrane protein YuiD
MPFSTSLISAVVVQLLCQVFKAVYYSVREKRLRLGYLFAAGGMPSGHAAFVTALTVSIGLSAGLRSDAFTIAFVFSVIIIYDILRIRSVVQRHSETLDALGAPAAPAPRRSLFAVPPAIGHTPAEVAVGIAAGAAFSAALGLVAAW